jgi:hypothetical protein
MPKSRHRKNHKKKVASFRQTKVNKERQVNNLMEQLKQEMSKQQHTAIEGPTISLTMPGANEDNFTLSS